MKEQREDQKKAHETHMKNIFLLSFMKTGATCRYEP